MKLKTGRPSSDRLCHAYIMEQSVEVGCDVWDRGEEDGCEHLVSSNPSKQ